MPSRKRDMRDLRRLCAEVHADDGVDPRDDKRHELKQDRKPDRKLRQLCQQVAQTLQLALADLPQADALVGVCVRAVTPAPNAGRLCAVLSTPHASQRDQVAAIVQQHAARLRAEVAAAITRRRTPEITYEVVLAEVDHD
jgi:ribosome-binding factor A